MSKILYTYFLVFLFSITANAQEKTIISFQTKNGKTMKLTVRQKDSALIYRLYNKDKVEMQYPKIPSISENKNFSFTYLNRFGGNINESTSVYRVEFFINNYRYSVFQSSYLGKNESGISVLDLNSSKVTDITAVEKTVNGNLLYFKDNQLITVTEL
ncbi:hypothetical protein [Cloacibacterium normanense]